MKFYEFGEKENPAVFLIDHAILGSSDMDQDSALSAKAKAWIIGNVLHGMFQKGELPAFMRKRLEKKPEDERPYYEKMLDMFGMNCTRMAFVRRESIQNQFYSDLVTPIGNNISVPGTTVHCFYAAKMGEEYLRRYQQHFKAPDIRRHDMQHEELLICWPERWVEEIKRCCRLTGGDSG